MACDPWPEEGNGELKSSREEEMGTADTGPFETRQEKSIRARRTATIQMKECYLFVNISYV